MKKHSAGYVWLPGGNLEHVVVAERALAYRAKLREDSRRRYAENPSKQRAASARWLAKKLSPDGVRG